MSSRVLLGLPLVLASSGCTLSTRVGPELRAQSTGAVLEGRGTLTAGLGTADNGQGVQLGIPISLSDGAPSVASRARNAATLASLQTSCCGR